MCIKGAHRLVRAFAISISSLQPAADVLHIALHALNEQRGVEAVGHGIEAPAEAVDHAVGRAR